MAMSKNGEPYLSTVNYYYDKPGNFFYFHCSPAGKKTQFLKSNPNVWGQIMEDLGYIQDECDHAYRTVHFKGKVEFLEQRDDKINALVLMMEQLEIKASEERKNRIAKRDLYKVAIGKIIIEGMTGKKNIPNK